MKSTDFLKILKEEALLYFDGCEGCDGFEWEHYNNILDKLRKLIIVIEKMHEEEKKRD